MYRTLISEIVKPLIRRAGTFVGSAALSAGLVADVAQVEGAVTLLLGIGFDLAMSHASRVARK